MTVAADGSTGEPKVANDLSGCLFALAAQGLFQTAE
jgi:hypothetical protein